MSEAVTISAREQWEQRFDLALSLAALAFLAAWAWPILDPGIVGRPAGQLCSVVTAATWVAFAVDYVARLALSRHRLRFVRTHLLDLATVALPLLRPLRLLRLVRVLSLLNRQAGASLRGRVIAYVVSSTALVIFVASLAMLEAERGAPNASIRSWGDALWWAITTVTTVGYGDETPVTVTGRFVAAGLMLAGIALLGVVTASIATWLIARVAAAEEESDAATRADLEELTREVARLREVIERGRPGSG